MAGRALRGIPFGRVAAQVLHEAVAVRAVRMHRAIIPKDQCVRGAGQFRLFRDQIRDFKDMFLMRNRNVDADKSELRKHADCRFQVLLCNVP